MTYYDPNDYCHDATFNSYKKQTKAPKYTKYLPADMEAELKQTISWVAKVLQEQFVNKTTSGARDRDGERSTSRHRGAETSGTEFEKILTKGKRKLEKLIQRYRDGEAAGWWEEQKRKQGYTTAEPTPHHYRSTSRNRTSSGPHYDSYGNFASGPESEPGTPGYVHQPDEIEEVESVRSSSRRHKSSSSRRHTHVPRAPSPPRPQTYTRTGRTVYEEGDLNPDYHTDNYFHSSPHTPSQSNSHLTPTSSPFRNLSLKNLNLSQLIEHAGLILTIIEKVMALKSGSSSSRHESRGRSRSGIGGGVPTAVKLIGVILALSDEFGRGRGGSLGHERRHH